MNTTAESWSINDLAEAFGVTLRALRFYESKGLLAPHRVAGVRRYGAADRQRLETILQGKRLGFTLLEIRGLLAGGTRFAFTRAQLVEQIRLLERQQRETEAALAALRTAYRELPAATEPVGEVAA